MKEKGEIMKSARVFLWSMYVHLLFSIAVPVGIVVSCIDEGWNGVGIGLFLCYLLEVFAVQIIGWVCVGMEVVTYKKEQWERLFQGWTLLKLRSIPFFVINFLYSVVVWFILVGGSRGILILLVPIPVVYTCTLVFQSGCVGICYIKYLRKYLEEGNRPSGIHYVLQLLAVADVVSTVVIRKRYHGDGIKYLEGDNR